MPRIWLLVGLMALFTANRDMLNGKTPQSHSLAARLIADASVGQRVQSFVKGQGRINSTLVAVSFPAVPFWFISVMVYILVSCSCVGWPIVKQCVADGQEAFCFLVILSAASLVSFAISFEDLAKRERRVTLAGYA